MTIATKENAKIGTIVKRNPKNWLWNNQDCDSKGNQVTGEIIELGVGRGYDVHVRWKNSNKYLYKFDQLLLAENTVLTEKKIGVRVKRNPENWSWGKQDHHNGKPGLGTTITGAPEGWIRVTWDNGDTYSYCVGYEGKFDLLLVEESETQETTKEKSSMKIPMPTEAIIATLNVDLQGERRAVRAGEFYLGESGGEFTMVVCQADRATTASFWIVQPKQKVFELNATSKVTIPSNPTAKVVVNVGGASPTVQEHSQTDIKRLAKQLTLPSTFHGNDMMLDPEAKVKIGCQTYTVGKILELAALLP